MTTKHDKTTIEWLLDILEAEEYWGLHQYDALLNHTTGPLRAALQRRWTDLYERAHEIDPLDPDVVMDNGVLYDRERGPA